MVSPHGTMAAAAVTLLLLACPASAQSPPTVTVKNGTYRGFYNSAYNTDSFLGMPFAQPPVGRLRFANPVPLNSSWSGTRDATAYGLSCVGYNGNASDYFPGEDCLTLNVVRSSGYEGQSLPVAAWIYGGGFFNGQSSDPRYNLTVLVANSVRVGKPIVGVSLNYRVSGWGFLKSADLVAEGSTNMGLRDQRLALHWLRENVGAFGGDPAKVTIWGQSAGAYSVAYQLIAYGGRDDKLFRGAVAQSGSALPLGRPTWDLSQQYYDNITSLVGCANTTNTTTARLACLRAVPFATLDTAFNKTWNRLFYPQPDGDFIRSSSYTQMLLGQFVKVPLLTGHNTDEGTAFVPKPINTDADLRAYIASTFPSNTTIDTFLKLYPDIPAIGIPRTVIDRPGTNSTYGAMYKRACAYDGDQRFLSGHRLTSTQWAAHNATVYSYRFDTAPYVPNTPNFLGVTHSTEQAFVWDARRNAAFGPTYLGPDKPPSYLALAELMSRMWIAFFHDLDPNSHGLETAGGRIPVWPRYVAAGGGYGANMVFDGNRTGGTEGVAYLEGDTIRAEAIEYMNSVGGVEYRYNPGYPGPVR